MTQPSKRAPKKLYWLDVVTTGKLRYREKGGGKYTNLKAALAQRDYLSFRGVKSVLFESKPIEWVEVKEDND